MEKNLIIHDGIVQNITVTPSNGLSFTLADDNNVMFHVLCEDSPGNREIITLSFLHHKKVVFNGVINGLHDDVISVNSTGPLFTRR